MLRHGVSLDFKEEPQQYREKNSVSASMNAKVLREKVEEWHKDGHVEKLDGPAWCTNPMSVAVKYDPVKDEVKLQPVIDLSRHVSKCMKVSHVKLDDLSMAEELIDKDDYMASFELILFYFITDTYAKYQSELCIHIGESYSPLLPGVFFILLVSQIPKKVFIFFLKIIKEEAFLNILENQCRISILSMLLL